MFVDTGINLDLPAGASQKPRLPKRSQILALIRTHVAQRTEGQEYPGERAESGADRHIGFPATRQGDGECMIAKALTEIRSVTKSRVVFTDDSWTKRFPASDSSPGKRPNRKSEVLLHISGNATNSLLKNPFPLQL